MKARIAVCLLAALLSFSALADKVVAIRRGSSDAKAILQAITPYAIAHSSGSVKLPAEIMRRAGDWAYVSSSVKSAVGNHSSAGTLIALLRKGRRWTIREISMAPTPQDQLGVSWEKQYALPKGLIGK